jgi:hypothetical protein
LRGKAPPSNEVIYELLSEKYGWTPQQIREQPAQDIINYLQIIQIKNAINKAEEMKSRKR